MPRAIIIDSGGTARSLQRLLVVDSGGITRAVRRAFVIDSGGTARLFFQSEAVQLSDNYSVQSSVFSPANPSCSFSVNSNGTITASGSGIGSQPQGNWLTSVPPANPGAYEIMAVQNSGPALTGTLNTWLSLSSNRAWSRGTSDLGQTLVNFTIQIRTAADGVVRDTGTVIFDLNKEI